MEIFLNSVIIFIINVYNSPAISLIKFLMGIYLIVLLVDIILLAIARGIGANIRYMFYGGDIPAELASGKKKTREKWNALEKILESEKESDWKIMVINADEMIFQLIRKLGYKGENMGEVLEKVGTGQIDDIEEIREAHEIKNKIVLEDDFQLSREVAAQVMAKFEKFLDGFEV